MSSLPYGCSFERSKLTKDKGRLCRIFYDQEGKEIYRVYGSRPTHPTGIDIDQRDDPTTYHREYYRRVRRWRDGRIPRAPT